MGYTVASNGVGEKGRPEERWADGVFAGFSGCSRLDNYCIEGRLFRRKGTSLLDIPVLSIVSAPDAVAKIPTVEGHGARQG
ncbi:hypothetical protein SAMN05216236_107116 [Sedimentitalea nanhaiensis]|uniref:Uncharacterized protein n=1 Tax=Sedimentitalea nanhaiensis TaxID=999627 RepID=A0A1I7AQ77_9RHOB|nr:hypothetical protein SAMN05216236_107116 [Sedimentitalea nanhaiensis]